VILRDLDDDLPDRDFGRPLKSSDDGSVDDEFGMAVEYVTQLERDRLASGQWMIRLTTG